MVTVVERRRLIETKERYSMAGKLLLEEERVFLSLKDTLRGVSYSIPDSSLSEVSGDNGYAKTFRKAGTVLVLSSPIPVVSDILGVGMLALGIVSEYKKRRKLRSLLEDYIYYLSQNTELV